MWSKTYASIESSAWEWLTSYTSNRNRFNVKMQCNFEGVTPAQNSQNIHTGTIKVPIAQKTAAVWYNGAFVECVARGRCAGKTQQPVSNRFPCPSRSIRGQTHTLTSHPKTTPNKSMWWTTCILIGWLQICQSKPGHIFWFNSFDLLNNLKLLLNIQYVEACKCLAISKELSS